MKKIYLASPYSHPDPQVMENRFITICIVAGVLMSKGYTVFSPIAHSHPIAQHLCNPLNHGFWLEQDLQFLQNWADEMWVCMMDGWDASKGIQIEAQEAISNNINIKYFRVEDADGIDNEH